MYIYSTSYVYVPFWFCPLAMALAVLATWVVADAISLTVATRLRPPVSWLGHTSILDLMSIIRHREASASALACCTNNWACSVGLHTHAHKIIRMYMYYTLLYTFTSYIEKNVMIEVSHQYSDVFMSNSCCMKYYKWVCWVNGTPTCSCS